MSYAFKPSPNKSSRRGVAVNSIVLHFTASAALAGTVQWFMNPEARVSAHYVIGRKGEIVQMVHESEKAWHAGDATLEGDPRVNSMSIGIEIVNWGELQEHNGTYYCWPGNYTRKYDISKYGAPITAIKNIAGRPKVTYWAPYTPEQYDAVIKLCREIIQRYPAVTVDRLVGHEDVAPGRKTDPGPAFDFDRVRSEVFAVADELYMDLDEDDPVDESELARRQSDRSEPMSWVERIYARWINRHAD